MNSTMNPAECIFTIPVDLWGGFWSISSSDGPWSALGAGGGQWWIVGGSFPGGMERALAIPPTLIESNHLDPLLEHMGATPVVGN